LATVVHESGLPPGVVNVVTGQSSAISEQLVASPEVDKISFTGSVAVGRRIAQAAAATLKRVHLELGGKSASLVLEDIDPSSVPRVSPPPATYTRASFAVPRLAVLSRGSFMNLCCPQWSSL